jgi:hypothetical protein
MGHVYGLGIKVGGNVHNASERSVGIHVDSGISGCSSKSISFLSGSRLTERIDPDTADIIDVAPFEYTRLVEEMTPLPKEFNAPWTEDDIFRTEVSCSVSSRIEGADE